MDYTRRQFLHTGLLGLAGALGAGCVSPPTEASGAAGGARLRARPRAPSGSIAPGRHEIDAEVGGGCTLFVPQGYAPGESVPLLVMLHGAGASRGQMDRFFPHADERRMAMLVPYSTGRTWDMILGGFGPDVALLDRALAHAFDRCAIRPGGVFLGGFSDGGSYALSVGLSNGDLFSRLVGFSPGFIGGGLDRVGKPRIFLTHGVQDDVLPIEGTSRLIARVLQGWGYDLTYSEFQGPHTVPVEKALEALAWLAG